MGIRIYKVLGYAISGLKYDKDRYNLIDDRINPLGYLGKYTRYEQRSRTWTIDGFLTYLKNNAEDNFDYYFLKKMCEEPEKFMQSCAPSDFYDSVIHNGEYGLPKVLMLVPTYSPRWHRHDDPIDYYEDFERRSYSQNSLKYLTTPIYPYIGYMDTETGKRLLDYDSEDFTGRFVKEMYFSYNSALDVNIDEKRKKSHMLAAQVYAERLNYGKIENAMKRYRPVIPDIVKYMCKYLCLFEDDSTIWQLQPAIYTYWS